MAEGRVKVWDLPTRLFHWGLVASLGGAWWTAETEDLETHLLFGYAALGLVLFRIVWGLVGSDTARFASFVQGPGAAFRHLRELTGPGAMPHHAGHNALGAYAVIALLALVAIQVGTGLFSSGGDIFLVAGPLNSLVSTQVEDLVETVHEVNFDLLLIAVGVHVVAILAYAVLKRLDLVRPMILGTAPLPPDARRPRMASPLLATAIAAVVAGLVWALSRYGG